MPPTDEGNLAPEAGSRRLRLSAVTALFYPAFVYATAFDAYDLGPIPVVWFVRLATLIALVVVGITCRLPRLPGSSTFVWMLLVGGMTTAVHVLKNPEYAQLLPSLGTTNYFLFVALRLVAILAFLATALLVFWLLKTGYFAFIVRATTLVGTIVALTALYIYFAQLNALPELPRTRMGTSGAEQPTRFTYDFHRATGSFREPAYLAEWLVLPFMLSLTYPGKRPINFHSATIGTVLLLTGSLTGIVGSLAGFAVALVLTRASLRSRIQLFFAFIGILVVAWLAFTGVARSYEGPRPSVIRVITERLKPVLISGLGASNRAYVYNYVRNAPLPFWGVGYGNANLLLTNELGSDATSSFLSLYLYTLYSTGLIGLGLMLWALLLPVGMVLRCRRRRSPELLLAVAAYFAWLVMFAVGSEELHLLFGVTYALVVFQLQNDTSDSSL